jgi:hypothetical protein
MKKYLLSCIILLAGLTASGQNYRCLQPGVKNFFINSDGYLRGIRIDSVKTYADSTVFYPYRTPRGPYGMSYMPVGGMHITDTNGGSWLGKKVTELTDGTTIFDGLWGDSVIIKTQANVGDSWMMYNDSGSIYYMATVTSEDTQTILSVLDSVKHIRINAFNSSGPLTSDPVNNSIMALSKNHGFAQVVDLYTFPYHKPDSAYHAGLDYFMDKPMDLSGGPSIYKMIFKIINFINPNEVQMHNWNIGDTLESVSSCGALPIPGGIEKSQNILNTVSAKSVSSHSTIYTLDGISAWVGCSSSFAPVVLITTAGSRTFYDTIYSILNPTRMPEDQYNTGIYSIYYFPDTNTNCFTAPLYIKRPARYMSGLGGYYNIFVYKLGIGLTYYEYMDGNPSFWESELFFFHINGMSCGSFVEAAVATISKQQVTISPNPATNELTIKTGVQQFHTIILQNLLGQSVKTIQTNRPEDTMNVSDLSNGIYIVTIADDSGNKSSHKVMIQH